MAFKITLTIIINTQISKLFTKKNLQYANILYFNYVFK